MLSKQRRQFTGQEKGVVVWMFVVLLSNSINIGVDNVIDMTFHFIENWTSFEEFWKVFMHFWFDLLILNNGLTMLLLYRHMANLQIK